MLPFRKIAAATLSTLVMGSTAQASVTTGTMHAPRMFHQASTLPDGRVLLTGGTSSPGNAPFASAEIYDGYGFLPVADMQRARREHAAIVLKDGRVLVAAGITSNIFDPSTAEIFDPSKGHWSPAAPMNTTFTRATGRLLPDGRAMVISKDGDGGSHAEVFDPVTGTFSKTGLLRESTSQFGLVVLADGRVLKIGGRLKYADTYSRNTEIWDPATDQWIASGEMAEARQDIQPVLLPDGKVLVAGGRSPNKHNSTEIYDPATGQFSPGSDMPLAFAPDSATVLDNGNIIFTDPDLRHMLHYQTATGAWNITGPKREATLATSVSRLADGNLLMTGGATLNDASNYAAVWDAACATQPNVVSSITQAVPGDGGEVSFVVHAAPGCRFEAQAENTNWLSLMGSTPMQMPESDSTNAILRANANMSGAERSASFYVANELVTVTQAVSTSCPWEPKVSPDTIAVPYQGGDTTAYVSAPAGCSWRISSMPSFAWILSGGTGTGNGSFSYRAMPNPDTVARSDWGMIDALGQSTGTFTFVQAGPSACPTAPKVTLSNSSFPAAGGTAIGTVSAAPACNWTIGALPSWASVTAGANGVGNGSFTISVNRNNGTARSAMGTASGPGVSSTFSLSQAAAPCSASIASGAPVNGYLKYASCPFSVRGSNYYADRYIFNSEPGKLVTITLSSSSFDTYLYLTNRWGTILKADNNSGGGSNSRISFQIPTGQTGPYTIEVTSYYRSSGGAYTLSLTQ
ncbi:MAG TPA: kelch repeat-containing protein [Pseudoduganella sp.]